MWGNWTQQQTDPHRVMRALKECNGERECARGERRSCCRLITHMSEKAQTLTTMPPSVAAPMNSTLPRWPTVTMVISWFACWMNDVTIICPARGIKLPAIAPVDSACAMLHAADVRTATNQ